MRTRIDAWQRVRDLQAETGAVREAAAAREHGVVHTPAAIAAMMARRLLHGVRRGSSLRVLDPGCGVAQLLSAVAREAVQRNVRVACEGVEIDARAARASRALKREVEFAAGSTLEAWRIRNADYLTSPSTPGRFDAIIANPPWVALRDVSDSYRQQLRGKVDLPARGDLAALFVERMLEDLAPSARLCIIVPNKLLAAEYARPLREKLLQQLHLTEIWDLSADAPFRARATYPVVLVGKRSRPSGRSVTIAVRESDGRLRATWSQRAIRALPRSTVPLSMPTEAARLLEHVYASSRLGEHVDIACGIATAGFARAIGRGHDRIVCSGDVVPFGAPSSRAFDPGAAGLEPARLERMRVAKVVVPGMFRRLHAAYDAQGRLLGRVYYISVADACGMGRARSRTVLLALLNSRLYAVLYRGLFAAVAQSGGWLRLNAPYLASMPWPPGTPPSALARAVRDLERRDSRRGRRRLDRLVEDWFELSESDRALVGRLDGAQAVPSNVHVGSVGRPESVRHLRVAVRPSR